MDRKTETGIKSLKISEDVIEAVIKNAVMSVDGVGGLFGKSPVKMDLTSEFPEVTVSVKLTYSCKAKNVCENIQKKVRDDILSMMGIALGAVNVRVEGIAAYGA